MTSMQDYDDGPSVSGMIYGPEDPKASDLSHGLHELAAATEHYITADAVFEGHQAEVFTSQRLAFAMRHMGQKFRLNFARTPVSAVLDRMEISAVACMDPKANAALNVIWTENNMQLEANDVHRSGLSMGDCYLMVWPDENGFPGMHWQTPLSTRIIYDSQNPRKKLFGIRTWRTNQRLTRVDIWYADRVERFISRNVDAEHDAQEYMPFLDDQNSTDGILPNPYGQIPLFHFRTQRPFGRPEHKDAYGPQDAINKHVIGQTTAVDFAGWPQRYILSEAANMLVPTSQAVDMDDWDDPVRRGENGNVQSSMQSGPGTMMEFVGKNMTIGEFPAADPDAFLKPLGFYVRAMAALTSTPLHLFEGMGDVPSGESLRAAEAPLNKKVRDRSNSFGATWMEALGFALEIVGIDAAVTIAWRDPQSTESKDSWETAVLQLSAGVPFAVVMQERGYSPAEVATWKAPLAPDVAGARVTETLKGDAPTVGNGGTPAITPPTTAAAPAAAQ